MHTLEQKQNTHIQFSSLQDTSNHLLAFVVVLCHISLKKVSCSFSLKKLLLGLEKDLNLLLEKAASCEGSLPLKKDGWSQQQEEASWVWDHNWQKEGAEAVQAMVCPAAGWPSCDQQSWNGSSAGSLEKGNWKCPDATCSAWKSWEAEQETWENWPQEPHPWRVGKSFWEEAQAYQLGSGWSWEESEGQAGILEKGAGWETGHCQHWQLLLSRPTCGAILEKGWNRILEKGFWASCLEKGHQASGDHWLAQHPWDQWSPSRRQSGSLEKGHGSGRCQDHLLGEQCCQKKQHPAADQGSHPPGDLEKGQKLPDHLVQMWGRGQGALGHLLQGWDHLWWPACSLWRGQGLGPCVFSHCWEQATQGQLLLDLCWSCRGIPERFWLCSTLKKVRSKRSPRTLKKAMACNTLKKVAPYLLQQPWKRFRKFHLLQQPWKRLLLLASFLPRLPPSLNIYICVCVYAYCKKCVYIYK